MGWWQAITSAFRTGRESRRRDFSLRAGVVFVLGALIGWLARRTSTTRPVHMTGAIGPQSVASPTRLTEPPDGDE
jgi:hypothetical protein